MDCKKCEMLLKEIELLRIKNLEYKVFGTDECPECCDPRAPIGSDYNRTTLFYRPKEHNLHIKELEK